MSGVFLGNVRAMSILSLAFVPTSVAANTTAEETFTVPGILPGDVVGVIKPTLQAGLGIVNQRVTAANTIAITYSNNTASPIVPTSETYQVVVTRPETTTATAVVA